MSVNKRLLILAMWLVSLLLLAGCRQESQAGAGTAAPPGPTPAPTPPIRPGDGSDLLDRLLANGVIRVGIRVWPGPEFSPPAFRGFSNARTGGALNGFEVDVARLLAEYLGLELELVEAYPPAIRSGDWRGQWDVAIASLVPFDHPGSPLLFSRPYAYVPMGLLVPTGADIPALDQLAGRRVGVLEYSAYQELLIPRDQPLTVAGQPLLAGLPAGLRPVAHSNLLKAIDQLAEGDPAVPDILFGPAPVFEAAIGAELPLKLATASAGLGYQPVAVAAIPQDGLKVDRLLAEINRVLGALERNGALAETALRWYGQELGRPNEDE